VSDSVRATRDRVFAGLRAAPIALFAVLALLALFALLACTTGDPVRGVAPAGFLKDYSELHRGVGEHELLVFIDPRANFSHYDRAMLDPITIWQAEDTGLGDVPREQLQHLTDFLEAALRGQIAQAFELVDRPGSDTLRIRVAISQAPRSQRVMDVVSRRPAPTRSLSNPGELATGTRHLVDAAALEVEILDSLSDQRMLAAVDERAGSRSLRGSTHAWSDVYEAFDYWADVLRTRLAVLRAFDTAQARIGIPPPP
jgi:hypothetical protein